MINTLKVLNTLLAWDGSDHSDRSCEKWSIT